MYFLDRWFHVHEWFVFVFGYIMGVFNGFLYYRFRVGELNERIKNLERLLDFCRDKVNRFRREFFERGGLNGKFE